jgi:8-hydroxy-5-deazaflavin:NADPH oxidoreductase
MRIGIIGAGHIGGTLARQLTELGDQVRVADSREPASLASLSNETGARAVAVEEAVRDVEIVIVTIPQKSVPELPKGLFDRAPKDVIVVDTGNYYPSWRDGCIEAIERGTIESVWVSTVLGRPVVKAFNNITAHSLAERARPKGAKNRIALPVAGDDPRAKSIVIALLDDLGFDGVDAGRLAESWRQQPGTPVYCTDLSREGVRRALAKADRAKASGIRELFVTKWQQLPEGTTQRELVQLARELAATAL